LLVRENGYFRDKSVSGHSLTLGETVEASSALIDGATAFEVSGLDSTFELLCFFLLIGMMGFLIVWNLFVEV